MNKTIGISEFLNVDTSDECLQFISDGIGHNKQLMKNNILRYLESRELTYFKEFEGIAHFEELELADNEGDFVSVEGSWGLHGIDNGIQLIVPEDSNPKDVLRLLRKITAMIEKDSSVVTSNKGKISGLNCFDFSEC